jgi:hypothetical protein
MIERYKEHSTSICKKDNKSALTGHLRCKHPRVNPTISVYSLEILDKCSSAIEATIMEAKQIEKHKPAINRKHEVTPL